MRGRRRRGGEGDDGEKMMRGRRWRGEKMTREKAMREKETRGEGDQGEGDATRERGCFFCFLFSSLFPFPSFLFHAAL